MQLSKTYIIWNQTTSGFKWICGLNSASLLNWSTAMAHASLASQTFILPKGKKSLGTCLFRFGSRNLELFCVT